MNLKDIKARHIWAAETSRSWRLNLAHQDRAWLIEEVERLRELTENKYQAWQKAHDDMRLYGRGVVRMDIKDGKPEYVRIAPGTVLFKDKG